MSEADTMAAVASSRSVAGDSPSSRSVVDDPPSPKSALGDPRFFARLDLNLLRVLVAIARFRSVTEAGRHLSLSQPATSNALARLREAFDDPLFVRAPGALAPTPLAARVAPIVARHLEELEAALGEHRPFDPASSATEWRLSLSDLGEIVFLSAIVEAVPSGAPPPPRADAPGPVRGVAGARGNGEIDPAGGIMAPRQRGLRSTVLFRERYVALSRRDCPRAWRTRRGFADAPLAVASPTATYHGEIAERIERVRLHSGIVVHARHFSTMPDLVARGELVAIVPEMFASMACERHDLAMWPIPTPTPRYEVCMVWHGALDTDPAQQWLRERVLQAFGR